MLSNSLRNAVTTLVLPLSWSRGRHHAATTLKRFSEVEFDSAWQYLNAMSYVAKPEVQHVLFHNVMEEIEHSETFLDVSHKLAEQRLIGSTRARVPLVKSEVDIPYFLAFAHESERAVCAQFNGYARACSRYAEASAVFETIAIDEEKHEREARNSLTALIGDERRVTWLIRRARLTKLYEAWLRGTRRLGDAVFAVWIVALFFVFGVFLCRYCKTRLGSHPGYKQTSSTGASQTEALSRKLA